MIAHGDSEAADEIEDAEQRPVQPGVIVEVGIGRDREESPHHDGEKEDDGPADMVTASQAQCAYIRRHRLFSDRVRIRHSLR